MELTEQTNTYRDRLRILLILYYFSENYSNDLKPNLKRVFRSEVRIQKIDFLIRYPSYLSYELLELVRENKTGDKLEIKEIVKNIFKSKEPVLRTQEMLRFFFGAYENLDEIVSFLVAYGFIEYSSKLNTMIREVNKEYFITDFCEQKITHELPQINSIRWYLSKCELIKKYFGDFSGSDLKARQYMIDEYKNTPLGQYIEDIENKTRELFRNLYHETL